MGYWGTSMGAPRPNQHLRAVEADLGSSGAPPKIAICGQCDTHAVLADDGKLPEGWIELKEPTVPGGKDARCPACKPLPRLKAREQTAEAELPSARFVDWTPQHVCIGEPASRYRGCRMGHELAAGMAAIQFRAGAMRPDGRDEAVSFMLDAQGIDRLIIELAAIREQLTRGSEQ